MLSGGASALLVHPPASIPLPDKKILIKKLLTYGSTIVELNTVRKHLSLVKGGFLSQTAFPAKILTCVLSDVIEDDLSIIGSGPTFPDASTYQDAFNILSKYELLNDIPTSITAYLRSGINGEIPETPDSGQPCFQNSTHLITASNRLSIKAAATKASRMGYGVRKMNTAVQGEAREIGIYFYELFRKQLKDIGRKPLCMIAGGETTVTVKGKGKGGRNQEMVLAFMERAMEESVSTLGHFVFISLGTDGIDGPTDAAGAFVTESSLNGDKLDKNTVLEYLNNNDAYSFFKRYGGLIQTGRTGTNVMDLQLLLAG